MLTSLSIDLDALEHYHRVHGIPEPSPGEDPVYGKAVERFGELCARLGIRGTAFCVGRNLDHPRAAAAVRRLAEGGHEVANHSFSHDYALSSRSPAEIAAELRGGADAIARVTSQPPVGFRAPGYTLSPALLRALTTDGYRYDSSAFPALPYYLGKAAVMGVLALMRQPSRAILDRPRVLLAPRTPYHPRPDEQFGERNRGFRARLDLPADCRYGRPHRRGVRTLFGRHYSGSAHQAGQPATARRPDPFPQIRFRQSQP